MNDKKKWLVTWTEVVHVGKEVVVEADTEEEAIAKRYENEDHIEVIRDDFMHELDTNVEKY